MKLENKDSGLLIVVPAWNESASIASTLNSLISQYDKKQILVVDDGSQDNTSQIVQDFDVHLITHPFNLGVGAAIRTGYKFAQANKFSIVVHFDADLQHRPEEIDTLVQALPDNDVVVGSRFKDGANYQMGIIRKLASWILGVFISKRIDTKISDVTSGFRASGFRAIQLFALSYPTEYLADTVESLVLAHDKGLKVAEVATPMDKRIAGKPSHGSLKSALHFLRAILVILSTLKRPQLFKLSGAK